MHKTCLLMLRSGLLQLTTENCSQYKSVYYYCHYHVVSPDMSNHVIHNITSEQCIER